ncbi:MAG: molecular chaperone [Pseudomonadota bacterium]
MSLHSIRKFSLPLLLCGLVSLGLDAHAAGLAVSPLRLDLRPGQQMTALTVSNTGKSALLVQGSVISWQQDGSAEPQTMARAMLLTPALFRLPPGGRQLVRIGWQQQTSAPEREQAYRVFMQEVPDGLPSGPGLQVSLRVGVPLFVAPTKAPVRASEWHWQPAQASQPASLLLQNNGNRHERITQLKVSDARKRVLRDGPLLFYVLPGAKQALPLPAGDITLPLLIETRSDQGSRQFTLTTPAS